MVDKYLKCPKCGSESFLNWKKTNGKLTKEEINEAKELVKKSSGNSFKVDEEGTLKYYYPYGSYFCPAKDCAIFCKCGYYSLDFQDLIEVTNIKEETKNNELNKEMDNLKKEISKLNKEIFDLKEERNKLKIENNYLKKENNKLKNDLQKANKTIQNFINQQNKSKNSNIEQVKKELKIKVLEINKLKIELENNKKKNKNKFYFDDIIVVLFTSTDQKIIKHPIKCLKTDKFAEIEEKLYKEFEKDKIKDINNKFLVNGKIILKDKKLYENEIKDGDNILLIN